MEISVFPRAFSVLAANVDTGNGEAVDVMRVTVQDVGGTVIHITFRLLDWAAFQAAVADHEEAASRAAARSKIVGHGGLASTIRERKH